MVQCLRLHSPKSGGIGSIPGQGTRYASQLGQKKKEKKKVAVKSIPPEAELSVQFSSVAQSCPALCNPMNCSMPGLPVHHQLPEFTQTHVH